MHSWGDGGSIPTAALGPRQEALKDPALVRICMRPTHNGLRAECLGQIGYLGEKNIFFHSLWPEGEKRVLYFDIIKISFVQNANLS